MYNDIEVLIDENVSLKRAFQVSKKHEDTLQQDNNKMKTHIAELQEKVREIHSQNQQLYAKNRRLQAQLANNNITFVSQIEQLKILIEDKERELQNFQLKMLPVVDQDMMRVKLITQMEGPYQQTVDKKDREIHKLKDNVHQLKRDKQMLEFTLNNKEKQLKNQLEECRKSYQSEIQGLQKHITHVAGKMNSGRVEKQLLRNYRNEIDQLRAACEFHKNQQDEQRKQLLNLRFERDKLIAELSNRNNQNAMQIKNTNNEGQIKGLKQNIMRLEDELHKMSLEVERARSKCLSIQSEKKKIQSALQQQIKQLKGYAERQRENTKNELFEYQSELRKLREYKSKYQQQIEQIKHKLRGISSTNQRLTEQNTQLRLKLHSTEHESSRHWYHENRSRQEKQIREKLQKQIYIRVRQEVQSEYRRKGQSPKKENDNFDATIKQSRKIKILQEKVQLLTRKIQFANKKIIQLLKQKAQRNQNVNPNGSKNLSSSLSPEHDYNKLLLEYRDSSFVPLCPPTIMQPIHHFYK